MASTKMVAKKKKKQKSPLKKFFSVFMIMISCFLTYMSAKEILTTIQLKQEIKDTEKDIEELQMQQEMLEVQKTQLEDEEYVKHIAHGRYLFSKEGETIYKFNDQETNTKDDDAE